MQSSALAHWLALCTSSVRGLPVSHRVMLLAPRFCDNCDSLCAPTSVPHSRTSSMAGTKYAYIKSFELPDPLLPNTFIVLRVDGCSFHLCVSNTYYPSATTGILHTQLKREIKLKIKGSRQHMDSRNPLMSVD